MNDIPCFEYQMCNTSTREKAWRLVYVTFSKGVKKRDLEIFKTASISRSFRVFREVMCEARRCSPQIGKKKEKEFIWKRSSVVFFINVILIFRFRARFKRGRRSDAFRLTFVVYAACAT